jgi:anti-sigma regulatory factor (Ser/Thr protein kinase)
MANRQYHRQETVRRIVEDLVARQGSFTNRDIVARTGTTRQAVHRHLQQLVREGALLVEGRGPGTRYRPAVSAAPPAAFDRRYPTAGLREDEVWREAARSIPPLAGPEATDAAPIVAYAFTEMVNNAIDHSGAPEVSVRVGQVADRVWFEVRDAGVGAFQNVRAALALPDHLAALQEITKGKVSTQPERHSGEGIFFTSKMADRFELEANGLVWLVDNLRADQAIANAPAHPGTTVRFEVRRDKRERPEEVFARYTHDFEFDTTRTIVRLFQYGVRFVSRSEAKRLLERLDRFRHVILDFAGVEAVGQGFADEVFRVWARAHPEIRLVAENMAPPVAFMVERARR